MLASYCGGLVSNLGHLCGLYGGLMVQEKYFGFSLHIFKLVILQGHLSSYLMCVTGSASQPIIKILLLI